MAESKERLTWAFKLIEEGVKKVSISANFQKYLRFVASFPGYSFNNLLLILSQKPDATLVAGYRTWQIKYQRQVKKGEKGIMILRPYGEKYEPKKKVLSDNEEEDTQTDNRERKRLRFTTATVFDISQTVGEPLENFNPELKGTSKEIQALFAAFSELVKIEVSYQSEEEDPNLKRAKGYYLPAADKIVINRDLEDKHKLKTLIHEYAHSILHKDHKKTKKEREIEAEALAYVICEHFKIDTGAYSFNYIAAYAADDLAKLKELLNNIQAKSQALINELEPLYAAKLKMKETKVGGRETLKPTVSQKSSESYYAEKQ